RGLQPRVVPEDTAPRACPLTTAYTARWAWDLALYLAYAELRVYRDGRLAGEVRYDSSAGGLNLGKFVDARKKIEEMTGQLFAG
ncbi:MAG TPA: Sbal_3080 family lipoprotein, partial [Acetobacteraceae bacterium]|nr:Sbal_3080 family lipoprotein [Acetobacteraceae bacterium]